METLIIGGLLVIGVAAIVALFFVLRGGTPQTKTPEAVPQTAREVPPTPVDDLPHATEQRVTTQPLVETTPEPETRTVPAAETTEQTVTATARPVYEKEQPLNVRLNGQFHELTQGLRSLQQQATEMEQRLGSLNQMLETIERDQPEEK